MTVNAGPNIVEDGLILSLDAANTRSYPGSGTTWTDLSGNGKNGTLTSGTIFSNDNYGNMNFDGVNDTVSFGTGNTFFPLNQFTINIWFKSLGTLPTTAVYPGIFGFTYGIRAIIVGSNLYFDVDDGTSITGVSANVSHNKWYNLVCFHSGLSMGMYLNNIPVSPKPAIWSGTSRWPTDTWNIGRDNNNNNYYFYGQIPIYQMYNRVLNDKEIKQNFNAVRSRYGI